MMLGIVFAVAALLLVAFGGFLAAADSAFTALSRGDLIELSREGRSRRALRAIAADPGAHLNAGNFLRVVAETTAAVLVTLALATVFDEWWWALILSALIMTGASFVLVGSSPRSVGRAHARTMARVAAHVIRAARVVLGPLADLLVALGDRVTPGRPQTISFSSEEQLLSMVDDATEAEVLEESDRELIHSIFEWGDTVIREVMVPRTEMITIEAEESVHALMTLLLETGTSRVPVLGEDNDDVLGIAYLRDVATILHERPEEAARSTAADLVREAMFVPESKKADATLRRMQLESTHLAMVVDEYGGIAGLVTLEDLMEELVGEISDEYDRDTPDVTDLGEQRYRVSARLATDELGDLFGLELDDDEVDSVGGLLSKGLGRLPERGASVVVSGLQLTADRVEGRGRLLRTVVVEWTPELAGLEQEERLQILYGEDDERDEPSEAGDDDARRDREQRPAKESSR